PRIRGRDRALGPRRVIHNPKDAMFRPTLSFRSARPDLRELADEDLMPLVHDGDARAFEVVFDRHADAAFSLAYRMCGRRAMAQDIVQDAFLSLWRSGARYDRARGSVRSWVLGVVRNRAIDLFRRETVRTGRDISAEGVVERMPASEDVAVDAERREDARDVRAALSDLPSEQRQVIELAYFGGFSHMQIAEMLEVPAGTVKGRMRLGLTKLRVALGDPSGALL
ncbi:MAG: RNA polymerase sigma factor, partial [Solirubrobacteraceae bacterium]